MKVAIIGGGPAGLCTLRFLHKAHEFFPIPPIDARLFEAEQEIGGTFFCRVYEDAELVSSKYLTAFSDFRLPRDAPDFLTPAVYVQYLKDYVAHFGLDRYIQCGDRVISVRRGSRGLGHVITVTSDRQPFAEWQCDAVAICTGLNADPWMPEIEGIGKIPLVIHSSKFKSRAQFGENSTVVVLGGGETAMDIAHQAVTAHTSSVALCHRAGFFCAPKIIPTPGPKGKRQPGRQNKPVDTSVASLFDTAYAHPFLQHGPLPWLAYDQWVKKMHVFISGTEEGPDQWVGHMPKERKHLDSILLVKSDKALPYLSAGHRSQSWFNRKRSAFVNVPIKDDHGKRIDVLDWPTKIDADGIMHVKHGCTGIRPDIIVFATGYATSFPFLSDEYSSLTQADVRGIYRDSDVSVGYIGFVRPSLGAIPPLAEMQSQLWVLRLLQQSFPNQLFGLSDPNSLAPYEMDYKLKSRASYDLAATKKAVDHESYAYQLALDMGAAPRITYVASKGWKVFFTWAMGSNFNPKFRLVGPWKMEDHAVETMTTELFDVVKQSGGFLYLLTYTIIPSIVFGTLSVTLYMLFGLYEMLRRAHSVVLRP